MAFDEPLAVLLLQGDLDAGVGAKNDAQPRHPYRPEVSSVVTRRFPAAMAEEVSEAGAQAATRRGNLVGKLLGMTWLDSCGKVLDVASRAPKQTATAIARYSRVLRAAIR